MTPITPDLLLSRGWKCYGNAWYFLNRCLTHWEGIWQIWGNGVNREVENMEQL